MLRNLPLLSLGLWLLVGCGGGPARGGSDSDGSTGGTDGTTGSSPGTTASTTFADTSGDTTTSGTGDSTGEDPPPPPTSPKANVNFKGPRRLEADLAAALELDPQEVCIEVGGGSCTREVHRVALGGVAPYDLSIYEPTQLGATAPIAVDRVVLRACQRRIDLDLESDAPVLLGVPMQGGGVTDIDGPEVDAFVDGLYTRGLLRHATAQERTALGDLYTAIEGTDAETPGRSWGTAACFAVLTSVEFLFY